jgi:hypothetical protein
MASLPIPPTKVTQSSSKPVPALRAENSAWPRFEPAALSEVFRTVCSVNEQLFGALVCAARSDSTEFPLSASLRHQVARLSSDECQRAARCGVLLPDANWPNSPGWRDVPSHDNSSVSTDSLWLPVEQSISLSLATLLVSWYVIHSAPAVARVLLGLTAARVAAYRELGVDDLAKIARRNPACVRPRWPDRLDVWTHLVEGASQSSDKFRSMTLRCLQASSGDSARRSTCAGSSA